MIASHTGSPSAPAVAIRSAARFARYHVANAVVLVFAARGTIVAFAAMKGVAAVRAHADQFVVMIAHVRATLGTFSEMSDASLGVGRCARPWWWAWRANIAKRSSDARFGRLAEPDAQILSLDAMRNTARFKIRAKCHRVGAHYADLGAEQHADSAGFGLAQDASHGGMH
jgi:hypothetical protein